MLRKFIKQKKKETAIHSLLLEEHLQSIKVSLLEIRCFRNRKVIRTPTLHGIQAIDIEEAWPGCRKAFHQAYALLCNMADILQVGYEEMPFSAPFGISIDQFVNVVDHITVLLDESEGLRLPQAENKTLDTNILKIQQAVNLIKKYVMTDFTYVEN